MYAFINIDRDRVSWTTEPPAINEPPQYRGAMPHNGYPHRTLTEVIEHLSDHCGVNKYDIRDDFAPPQPKQLIHPDLAWLAVECGINPREFPSNKSLAGAILEHTRLGCRSI